MKSTSDSMQLPAARSRRWRTFLPLALLAACLLFHFFNNYFWLQRSTQIEGVDVQNHLLYQLEFYQELQEIWQNGGLGLGAKLWRSLDALGEPVRNSTLYWPNLVYFTTYLHNLAFEQSLFVTKISTFFYLALTLIFTFLLGWHGGCGGIAILAAFLVGMFPMVFQSSRMYALDLPLTAMVTLCMYLLIRSNGFRVRRWAVLFGAALGLGMLVKGQIAIFLFSPMIYYLFRIVAEEHAQQLTFFTKFWGVLRSKRFLNCALSMIVATPIASIWWASKIPMALRSLGEHAGGNHKFVESGHFALDSTPYSWKGITWQLSELVTGSLGEPLAVILAVCLVLYFWRKRANRTEIALWLAVPFLLFSILMMAKHARFLMPLLPALALVMATVIISAAHQTTGKIALIALISYSLIQFFYLSYVTTNAAIEEKSFANLLVGGARYAFAPGRNNYQLDQVAHHMVLKNRCKKKIKVGFVNNATFPGSLEQLYLLMLENNKIEAQAMEEMAQTFFKDLPRMDYLVYMHQKDSSLSWPEGETFFKEFLYRHGIKYYVNFKDSVPFHEGLKALSRAKGQYRLRGVVPVYGHAWYIYSNRSPGLMLREDFEQQAWNVKYKKPWSIQQDGDRRVLDCPGQEVNGQKNDWLNSEMEGWSNYTLSLEYKIISFSEGVGFRLHVYRTPQWEYQVEVRGDSILLRKIDGQKILWETRAPYEVKELTWRKIQVGPIGGAIMVKVDGQQVLTHFDKAMLPYGEVAIDTHNRSHIRIDNLEIMENWNCEGLVY